MAVVVATLASALFQLPVTPVTAQGNAMVVEGDVTLVVLADKAPNAQYSHGLYLHQPLSVEICQLCPDEPVSRLLGTFSDGSELVFRLRVTPSGGSAYDLFSTDTGDAFVTEIATNAWRISWEDGGGAPAGDMLVAVATPDLISSRLFGGRAGFLGMAGDPVEVSTGNVVETRTDLVGPQGAYGLDLERTYNSADARTGLLGRGWSTRVDQRLTQLGGNLWEWRMPDGRTVVFEPLSSSTWDAVEDLQGELVNSGTGKAFQYHSGERVEFDAAGQVTRWCAGVPNWKNKANDWCRKSSPAGGEYVTVDRSTANVIKLINPRANKSLWLNTSTSAAAITLANQAQTYAGTTALSLSTYTYVGFQYLRTVNAPGEARYTYSYTTTSSAGMLNKIEERVDDGAQVNLPRVAH